MLRARLSKILSSDFLQQIAETPSLADAFFLLRNTSFAILEDFYNKSGDLKLGELELFGREVALYRDIAKYMKNGVLEIVRSLSVYYEIENLKNALRLFFDISIRGRTVDEGIRFLYRDKIYHEMDVTKIVIAQDFDGVIDELRDTPYGHIVEKLQGAVTEQKSLFPLEVALDHYYYLNIITKTQPLNRPDREITLRLIGIEIDLQNINWIIRFKNFHKLPIEMVLQFVIPHGFSIGPDIIREAYVSQNVVRILQDFVRKKYPGLATLLSSQATDAYSRLLLIDRILEQILMHEVGRMLSGYPFTIGIVLSYFILKRNEMRRIAAILNAKQYKLPVEGLM
jgi:V/A-type H+-transporting ATPase subunit C